MPVAAGRSGEDGWQAGLTLGFSANTVRTVLAERRRHGPLAVQRALYPEGPVCHVYVLHPPGGVVGGDSLRIDARCSSGSHAVVTTPGATKFYRSVGRTAEQRVRLRIEPGASLEWLPLENILFPGADVRLQTTIALAQEARLAFWEVHCLGRPANDERFDSGSIDSALRVERDGIPLLVERLRVAGDRAQRQRARLAGHPVTGTLLMAPADAEALAVARALLPPADTDYTGVSLLEDLLVVRYLGDSTERARRLFEAIWSRLRPACLGRPASPPRIWST
jgi:urease accessory protein